MLTRPHSRGDNSRGAYVPGTHGGPPVTGCEALKRAHTGVTGSGGWTHGGASQRRGTTTGAQPSTKVAAGVCRRRVMPRDVVGERGSKCSLVARAENSWGVVGRSLVCSYHAVRALRCFGGRQNSAAGAEVGATSTCTYTALRCESRLNVPFKPRENRASAETFGRLHDRGLVSFLEPTRIIKPAKDFTLREKRRIWVMMLDFSAWR